jgi:hypothetical protein
VAQSASLVPCCQDLFVLEPAPSRREVRVSDEDRERAAQALRDHFAAGRLEATELERRLTAAYAARTRGDLAKVLSDLPSDPLGRVAQRAARRAGRRLYGVQRTALKYHAGTYVVVNGSLVGVWELAGHGFFWPGLVLAPTSVLLAFHAAVSRWLRERLGIDRRRGARD